MPFPALSIYTAVIAADAAVSGPIEMRDQPLVGIQADVAWTDAAICLDASFDGTLWGPVYNAMGDEVALTVPAAAHSFISISPHDLAGVRFLRLRSGLTGAAVNQTAARTLSVIARVL